MSNYLLFTPDIHFCRVANLAFLKPDFEILAFFERLWLFLGNKKKPDKIWIFLAFFQSERLGSGKTLLELYSLQISSERVCRLRRILKKIDFCPKIISVIDKKQMYDNVIMGKENASKEWNCIISMFLTSFNVYFVFGFMHVLAYVHSSSLYAVKMLSGFLFFWLFLGRNQAFFNENRLATLHFCRASGATPGQPR